MKNDSTVVQFVCVDIGVAYNYQYFPHDFWGIFNREFIECVMILCPLIFLYSVILIRGVMIQLYIERHLKCSFIRSYYLDNRNFCFTGIKFSTQSNQFA